ncbi:hypothetical protein [Chitinophaga rhizophila]|uniref:Uncharacterized protein n=1 Tax=Chitinophaga rhizophila TaxID=2866212 RepID=A0ABS7GKS3_9BACT|nr:hypothetical protein [Chitinophaga rhizophila]MBW8688331.1 hypothetical protein [Chitinophaga rhizophila]
MVHSNVDLWPVIAATAVTTSVESDLPGTGNAAISGNRLASFFQVAGKLIHSPCLLFCKKQQLLIPALILEDILPFIFLY